MIGENCYKKYIIGERKRKMEKWSSEAEAREHIKALVAQYYRDFKQKKKEFVEGDRISYASRVFDEKEMMALTDATLDFWLTTGRFSDQFEKEFASLDWRKVCTSCKLWFFCKSYCIFSSYST